MKKYELTDETITIGNHTLHRIRALRDFGNVKAGELGGFVESEKNLSHYNDCWIADNARVYGDAWVRDNALVYGDAWVRDNALVYDNARVYGNALVCGDALVCGNALIKNQPDIVSIGLIGSRNDTTTFYRMKDGTVAVSCGCFSGTIDEFENAVHETHSGTIYEKQYNAAIAFAKAYFSIEDTAHE